MIKELYQDLDEFMSEMKRLDVKKAFYLLKYENTKEADEKGIQFIKTTATIAITCAEENMTAKEKLMLWSDELMAGKTASQEEFDAMKLQAEQQAKVLLESMRSKLGCNFFAGQVGT